MESPVKAEGASQQAARDLCITVLFSDPRRTRLALASGIKLAQDLNASFQIVALRVVPYPLSLDHPPISRAFTERQISELTKDLPIAPHVRICDCRDPEAALLQFMDPASVVIAGFRKTWWPSQEKKLVRALIRAGHEVVFTP
jgi:hypothetical protein